MCDCVRLFPVCIYISLVCFVAHIFDIPRHYVFAPGICGVTWRVPLFVFFFFPCAGIKLFFDVSDRAGYLFAPTAAWVTVATALQVGRSRGGLRNVALAVDL